MKKTTKILTCTFMLVFLISAIVVSAFADYTFEYNGQEYTLESVYEGEVYSVGGNFDFDSTKQHHPDIYGSTYITDNNYLHTLSYNEMNEFYVPEGSSSTMKGSDYFEFVLPYYANGCYDLSFDMVFNVNDTTTLKTATYFTPSTMVIDLLQNSMVEGYVRVQTIDSETLENASVIYSFLESGAFATEKVFRVTYNATFDFDNEMLIYRVFDAKGKEVMNFDNSLDISLFASLNNDFIKLRFACASGYSRNTMFESMCVQNFKCGTVCNFDNRQLEIISTYIKEVTDGNNDYIAELEEVVHIQGQDIAGLNGVINQKDEEISGLNNTIAQKDSIITEKQNELAEMTDKYDTAKEGLDNSNAVLNFFQGIYEAVQGALNTFLNLEVFGFTLGNIVAVLLGAVVVIIVLKIIL